MKKIMPKKMIYWTLFAATLIVFSIGIGHIANIISKTNNTKQPAKPYNIGYAAGKEIRQIFIDTIK